MLSAAECEEYATECRRRADQPGVSNECALVLKNIARSLRGLSGQLDRFAALQRDQRTSPTTPLKRASGPI